VLVIYAYGSEITSIDLEELRSEQRQTSLVRVMRALEQPDILAYEQESQQFTAPVDVTCPADGTVPELPAPDPSGPYAIVAPSCAEPGETVTVDGFNFYPNGRGSVISSGLQPRHWAPSRQAACRAVRLDVLASVRQKGEIQPA